MSSQIQWVLYDSTTKSQSKPMEKDQLQLAIYKMSEKDFKRFFIWKSNWENWQSLEQYLTSDQKDFFKSADEEKNYKKKLTEEKTVRKERTITKSVTKIRVDGEFTKTTTSVKDRSFSGDNLTWSGSQSPNNLDFKDIQNPKAAYLNRAVRHELKIEILLTSVKGKIFRSFSKNISLTGSLLEDNVPFDYYNTLFDVIVINRYAAVPANSRVQLKAKTAGQGLTSRIQFENISEIQKKKLKALLEEYLIQQENNKKPA